MLIEFRVENHRSIQEEQTLSFEASSEHPEGTTRRVRGFDEPLLHCAALYGANGSGKSNVLRALHFMCRAVTDSQRLWAPHQGVPRAPFAWGEWRQRPSLFEVYLVLDGVRYRYGFEADDERILEEWLHAWPEGHEQTWFAREGDEVAFGSRFRGERQVYQKVLRPNALLLSTLAQLNHEPTGPLYDWFARSRRVAKDDAADRTAAIAELIGRLEQDPTVRTALTQVLRLADLGILSCDVGAGPSGKTLWLQQEGAPDAWLPLEQASRGTQALIHLVLPLVVPDDGDSLLMLDEVDNDLHPTLSRALFASCRSREGQVLFSTHDATLLGTAVDDPCLRRDPIWITEKSSAGATTLLPLTDFQPRKSENLERSYLQGRYGGVPRVEGLAQALQADAPFPNPPPGVYGLPRSIRPDPDEEGS